jgi:hypothetical protein
MDDFQGNEMCNLCMILCIGGKPQRWERAELVESGINWNMRNYGHVWRSLWWNAFGNSVLRRRLPTGKERVEPGGQGKQTHPED